MVHGLKLMSWENEFSDYEQKSFMVTFTTLLHELDHESPDSGNLLRVLSYFDPDKISLHMINEGVKDLQLPSASGSKSPQLKSLITVLHCPAQLQRAIKPLHNLSLVRCKESTQGRSTLHIHEEIQYVMQEIIWRLGDDCWYQVAVGLIYGAFQQIGDAASHKCWAQYETLSPHIISLSKLDDRHTMVDARLDEMNIGLGHYLTSRGRYSEAEVLFRQAHASAAELHGPEHADTLRIGEDLARVYWELGRYVEAQALLHQILTSREKDPGTSLNTLGTIHNLARTYHLQGQYKKAVIWFSKAFAGREKALGSGHPDTLQTMHYIAHTYRDLGWYCKAESLFKQALAGREKILGPEHSDTLKTMTVLATVYSAQGQYDEAEKMFGNALAIKKEVLRADHPSTLVTIYCQAMNKRSQGQYDEAERLFGEALAGRENILGPEHPDTLKTVQNLAVTYDLQARYGEAVVLYGRALAGREKVLGHDHPHTLETVRSLARFFKEQSVLLQNHFPLAFNSTLSWTNIWSCLLDFFYRLVYTPWFLVSLLMFLHHWVGATCIFSKFLKSFV
jgi:tetratricopeptide (TPR) repeat protein